MREPLHIICVHNFVAPTVLIEGVLCVGQMSCPTPNDTDTCHLGYHLGFQFFLLNLDIFRFW